MKKAVSDLITFHKFSHGRYAISSNTDSNQSKNVNNDFFVNSLNQCCVKLIQIDSICRNVVLIIVVKMGLPVKSLNATVAFESFATTLCKFVQICANLCNVEYTLTFTVNF